MDECAMLCHLPLGPGSGPGYILFPRGGIADTVLLSYLSALDQAFGGVWVPYRMHKSTHVVLCFSGLDPDGMWALHCLNCGYLDGRTSAVKCPGSLCRAGENQASWDVIKISRHTEREPSRACP